VYSIFAAKTPSKSSPLTSLGKTQAASTKLPTAVSSPGREVATVVGALTLDLSKSIASDASTATTNPVTGRATGHGAGGTAGEVANGAGFHAATDVALKPSQLLTSNTNAGYPDYSIRDGSAVNSVGGAGVSGLGPGLDDSTSWMQVLTRTSGDDKEQTLGKRELPAPP